MNGNKEVELVEQEKLSIDKSMNTAATYSFRGEDHTLGNLLRSMLMKE
jgi:DNA-directed RNA polymerase subunit L